jgi:hypothetical protein
MGIDSTLHFFLLPIIPGILDLKYYLARLWPEIPYPVIIAAPIRTTSPVGIPAVLNGLVRHKTKVFR